MHCSQQPDGQLQGMGQGVSGSMSEWYSAAPLWHSHYLQNSHKHSQSRNHWYIPYTALRSERKAFYEYKIDLCGSQIIAVQWAISCYMGRVIAGLDFFYATFDQNNSLGVCEASIRRVLLSFHSNIYNMIENTFESTNSNDITRNIDMVFQIF